MNTGDKKTWTRIAAAVAAVVLLAVCFALSKDVCLALSRREMTLTGTVADKSVTWQGPTLVLRTETGTTLTGIWPAPRRSTTGPPRGTGWSAPGYSAA